MSVEGITPFPGIDRSAQVLEPVQTSAKPGEGPLPIPGHTPPRPPEGMREQPGGPGPQHVPQQPPLIPHVLIHYKVFYADQPPYENTLMIPGLIDIRSVTEYNNTINALMEQHKAENPVRVIVMNWKRLERG